jgi:outer membrane biogenesis lipoprotein LolB
MVHGHHHNAAVIEREQPPRRAADSRIVAGAATGPQLPLRVLADLNQQ